MTVALVSLPITYRRSTLKLLFAFAASLVFAAVCLAMSSDEPLVGYVGAVFFGLGAIVFAVNLHPNAHFLELTEKGFTTCSMFRREFTRWEDVREFYPLRIRLISMVGINLAEHFHRRSGAGRMSKALNGVDGALDTYGMSAYDLAAILNSLLKRRIDEH